MLLFMSCPFGAAQAQAHGSYVGGGLRLEAPYTNLGSSGFSYLPVICCGGE